MVSQDIAKAKISFNEGFVYFKQNTVLGYLMKKKKKKKKKYKKKKKKKKKNRNKKKKKILVMQHFVLSWQKHT